MFRNSNLIKCFVTSVLPLISFLQVSDQKKHTSSTAGMQTTVQTSDLLQHRVQLVPGYMDIMRQAIRERDYKTFAELTIKVGLLTSSMITEIFCNFFAKNI